ncbi:MAG: hypothetical protein AAFP84_11280 [Actinomycetota bacterium]
MRSRSTLTLALVASAMLTVSACSVSETLDAPTCTTSSSTPLISVQSVPSAELIMCLDPLPAGWEAATVDIGHEGTFVTFDSDRAGRSAAKVRFEASCDIGDATQTPTEFDDVRRFEWILEVAPRFRAKRYYVFEGGCVTWEFDFDADAPAGMAVELGNTLRFFSRDDINAQFRDSFIEEDL